MPFFSHLCRSKGYRAEMGGLSKNDPPSEKRKVGGSTPPLTTISAQRRTFFCAAAMLSSGYHDRPFPDNRPRPLATAPHALPGLRVTGCDALYWFQHLPGQVRRASVRQKQACHVTEGKWQRRGLSWLGQIARFVQRLPRQWCGERCGREIVEVIGNDYIGTACPRSRDHMPVIWIRQLDGLG